MPPQNILLLSNITSVVSRERFVEGRKGRNLDRLMLGHTYKKNHEYIQKNCGELTECAIGSDSQGKMAKHEMATIYIAFNSGYPRYNPDEVGGVMIKFRI